MTSSSFRASPGDDPRAHPDFDRVLNSCLEELNATGFVDSEEILRDHPELGPAILEDLELYIGLGSSRPRSGPSPLGSLGDYTLRRQIGRGGMGVVYEAWENSMNRAVALKVLPAGIAADTRATARFMREAQAAGKLGHPSVVPVHAMGVYENTPYYSMEYIEGETLAEILGRIRDAEPETETPFGKKDCAGFFEQVGRAFADVADGLQHAHSRGVVHRDIKPSNLILDRARVRGESGNDQLRILDFGLARLEGEEALTLTGDCVGTPLYMSPEQARRRKISVDHRTDVYSLGATLYEVVTGRPPFRGKDNADTLSRIVEREPVPPRKLNPRIPKDLETVVLKCLRKARADRYGTAEALAQDLRRFVRRDPVEARPISTRERLAGQLRRRWRPLLAGAVVLALAVSVAWLVQARQQAERERQIADFGPRLHQVFRKVRAAEFTVRAASGWSEGLFSLKTNPLAPLTGQDIRSLLRREVSAALAEAAAELAELIASLPKRMTSLPGQRDAYYHLARAYRLLGERRRAREQARLVLDLDPEFVPARVLAWELSGASVRANPASFATLKPQAGESGGWRLQWFRAYRALRRSRWKEAEAAYGDILSMEGRRAEPYLGCYLEAHLARGVSRLGSRKYERALSDFIHARALTPGIESSLLIAKAYYLSSAVGLAEEEFARLYQDAEEGDRLAVTLGIIAVYDTLGDYGKALDWSRRLGPGPIATRLELGYLHHLGRYRDAIDRGREAVARDATEDLTAHLILAAALLKDMWSGPQADREEDIQLLLETARRATRLHPDNPTARALLAQTAMEASRLERRTDMSKARNTLELAMAALVSLTGSPLSVAQEPSTPGGSFEGAHLLEEVNSDWLDWRPVISHDGRSLVFGSNRPGGVGRMDLYIASREGRGRVFTRVENLTSINSTGVEPEGCLSPGGLEIFFTSNRPGGPGRYDIYVATRNSLEDAFGTPTLLEGINTESDDGYPWISGDGLSLYFGSEGKGVLRATRTNAAPGTPFGLPEIVFDTLEYGEFGPSLSADGKVLFFGDGEQERPGTLGGMDLWMVMRSTSDTPFPDSPPYTPINLGAPVNTAVCETLPSISSAWPAAGSELFFVRQISCVLNDFNGVDIYVATWRPDVPVFRRGDVDGNGILEITDAVNDLAFQFLGQYTPICLDAHDFDDNGLNEVTDAVNSLAHQFLGDPPPPAPGTQTCGEDPTEDELDCDSYACETAE